MDFDGDGQADIISGSYHPGNLYFFKGSADGTFAKGEFINGADGNPVNVGPAAAVFAADFDGKGLLDLVIGNIQGEVFLLQNLAGTRAQPKFAQPKKLRLGNDQQVQGDAGPCIADWDGDGKLDLIVGDNSGAVRLYRNQSRERTPDFANARILVKATSQNYEAPAKEGAATVGTRTKPHVADFNGDGRLDLLVGDVSYTEPAPAKPIAQPAAASNAPTTQPADAQKHLREVLKEYQAESAKLRALPSEAPADERAKLKARCADLLDRVKSAHEDATRAQRHLLEERAKHRAQAIRPQIHGYVWFFERKKAE